MPAPVPPELAALLDASDPATRESAWEAFVAVHSRLILHAIRRLGGTHDAVMDRYAYVLEQLRADDYRRLRTWAGRRDSRVGTWLVVVVTRLCHDHHRRQYGRNRPAGKSAEQARALRRTLADLAAGELDPELVAAPADSGIGDGDPEQALREAELRATLADALSALAPADQLLLTLRFRDGLSGAAIARAVGQPSPFHVYRRLNGLYAELRVALARRGVEDPVP